jgi:hypothetical protein
LKNASKGDLKFSKWNLSRLRKIEVGGQISTLPMQRDAQTSFPSFSFAQEVGKIYTRYKYTAILEDSEKREGMQTKRNNNNMPSH